jgi:hypothetical protein
MGGLPGGMIFNIRPIPKMEAIFRNSILFSLVVGRSISFYECLRARLKIVWWMHRAIDLCSV